MTVTKTTTKTYDVKFYPNAFPNVKWGWFRDARIRIGQSTKEFSKCFVCGHEFADDERVIFITVSTKGNLFGCSRCASKYKENPDLTVQSTDINGDSQQPVK